MWLSISILVALLILAVLAYLYTAQKDTPIAANERYMMVYEDGLLELVGGMVLVLAGVMFDVNPGLIAIFVPLFYAVLLSAKTAITKPRLDPAELTTEVAKRRQLKMLMVVGLALLVGMVAFVFFVADIAAVRSWLTRYLALTLVLVLTALLTLWAYRTGARQLYLYAALVLVLYVSSYWLAVTFPMYLIAVGIGMMLIGMGETIRFVQEHPKLPMSS